jgi:hypothetical protein
MPQDKHQLVQERLVIRKIEEAEILDREEEFEWP